MADFLLSSPTSGSSHRGFYKPLSSHKGPTQMSSPLGCSTLPSSTPLSAPTALAHAFQHITFFSSCLFTGRPPLLDYRFLR